MTARPAEPYRLHILRRLMAAPGSVLTRRRTWNRSIQSLMRRYPIAPPARSRRPRHLTGAQGKRLRIAIFTRWPLAHVGGLATYIRTLRDGLEQRGHHVTVISQDSFPSWNALCRRLRPRLLARFRRAFGRSAPGLATREAELQAYTQLVRRLDLRRYDVLHAQDLFTANILIELRPWHRRPVVYTPHGLMSLRKRIRGAMNPSPFTRLYHRVVDHIAASGADHVVVLSRQFPRRVLPLGASLARLTVSHSGARDPNLPAPSGRRRPGVPLTVTYVGRMKTSKGPQFLLQAMARVQRLVPPTRVWLIGKGPTLPALRRLSRRLGVRRVTFWGYQRDVYRLLRRSDILVVPGLDETFPMALIEGLLAGQAVVASRCGGIPDMIEHGRTGLLFPPGNTRALARHLVRLLTDDSLRLSLATHGQRQARVRFSWQRMIADMEAVYASLASR